MSGQKFSLDLSALVKKAKGNMDAVVRKIILDIGSEIVMRSPVGDPSKWLHPAPAGYTGGRFRANWQYGEAEKPTGTVDAKDPSGAQAIARIAAKLAPSAAGKLHFITNNLPYAMRLETGWSKQAPGGMVGITIRRFQEIVKNSAREGR